MRRKIRHGYPGPTMRKSGSQPGRVCALVERCSERGAAVESRRAARADWGGSIAGGRTSRRAQAVLQGRKYRGVFGDRRGVRWLMDWRMPFLGDETIALDEPVFSNIVQRKIEHRLTCWLLPALWGSVLFSGAFHRGGEAGGGLKSIMRHPLAPGSGWADRRVAAMTRD